MIKESSISFETAKLAKEKGFRVHISDFNRCFDVEGNPIAAIKIAQEIDYWSKNGYPIVTQSLLQKWLRDTHGINIEIGGRNNFYVGVWLPNKPFRYLQEEKFLSKKFPFIGQVHTYETKNYEAALERGLLVALKSI